MAVYRQCYGFMRVKLNYERDATRCCLAYETKCYCCRAYRSLIYRSTVSCEKKERKDITFAK